MIPSRIRGALARGRRRLPALVAGAVLAIAALVGSTLAFGAGGGPGAPTFVQQVSKRGVASSLTLTPANAVTVGNRLIVQAGVWSNGRATAANVTDSAGNTYTKLTAVKASDNTELSVWSAPITAGDATRPTITITATGTADIGAAALEYSGLSTATGTTAIDQLATATGTTGTTSTPVAAGATAPTTADGELAIGFYADSGFNRALSGDSGFATRVNVSPTTDMEFLVQDAVLGRAGGTPNPATTTGAKTPWLAATVVFKTGGAAGSALPAAQVAGSDATGAGKLVYASAAVAPVDLGGGRSIFLCPLGPLAGPAPTVRLHPASAA
jgi:hypothetical protein